MFLTKRHLSRRAVLKGAGVTLALAPARRDGARGDAAGPDRRVAEAAHGVLLHPPWRHPRQHVARRRDGQVDAARRGRGLHAQPHPQVARPVQALRHLVRQPVQPGDGGRRARVRAGHVAERHAPRQGIGGRQHVGDARSDRGAADRPEHVAPVARGVVGNHAAGGGVQRLGVLLQHHALVPRRALAAADGVQPEEGVRHALRRGRHAGGARRHPEPDAQPAGPHHRPHARPAARPRRGRPGRARQLSRNGPRDRAPREHRRPPATCR